MGSVTWKLCVVVIWDQSLMNSELRSYQISLLGVVTWGKM